MSEKELNSYRFSPEQEPTDEMLEQIMREVAEEAMLEQIMREVAEEAKESNRKATERYFEAMRRNALAKQAKWAHAIEMALNENMQVIEK